MTRTAKDYTPEEIETCISDAMQRAFTFFPASETRAGGWVGWEQHAKTIGVDMNLAALSALDLSYTVEKRLAFGLSVRFDFAINYGRHHRVLYVTCNVKWASGGGDPASAVAQAALHLETAQKAAQCQMAVNDAFNQSMRVMNDEPDREAFIAGVELFQLKVEAIHEAIQAEHNPRQRQRRARRLRARPCQLRG